jgi:hypothetical protein
MIEDLESGGISGSSPLMAELARSRGTEMRAAVATLQKDQDRLVRFDPRARLVLRGGPGTGKTVVALHRAAWMIYNDRRITDDRLLVVGPSDRFLRYVATVLPTLGELRVQQTTFERHLGPSSEVGADPLWLDILDRFEASLIRPRSVRVAGRTLGEDTVIELAGRATATSLPWRDRRRNFIALVASRLGVDARQVAAVAGDVMPSVGVTSAWRSCGTATCSPPSAPIGSCRRVAELPDRRCSARRSASTLRRAPTALRPCDRRRGTGHDAAAAPRRDAPRRRSDPRR